MRVQQSSIDELIKLFLAQTNRDALRETHHTIFSANPEIEFKSRAEEAKRHSFEAIDQLERAKLLLGKAQPDKSNKQVLQTATKDWEHDVRRWHEAEHWWQKTLEEYENSKEASQVHNYAYVCFHEKAAHVFKETARMYEVFSHKAGELLTENVDGIKEENTEVKLHDALCYSESDHFLTADYFIKLDLLITKPFWFSQY